MQPLSARFTAALAGPHTVVARVDVIRAGVPVERLESIAQRVSSLADRATAIAQGVKILDGKVSVKRTGGVRRTLNLTLVDPPPLTAYGDRLKVWRGVRFDDGTVEYAALGVFEISQLQTAHQGGRRVVTVEASDLSRTVALLRWNRPYTIATGTLFTDAIVAIVEDRLPGVQTRVVASPLRLEVGMMHDGANDDPWTAVQKLAAACNRDAWFDPHGTLMVVPPPARNDPIVHTVTDGVNGTILSTSKREDSDPGPNGIIVVGENPAAGADIHGEAYDDDPASPTWRFGLYGSRVKYIGSPLVHSNQQAREIAASELAKLTLVTVALDTTAAPHPGLEAGDRVRVVRRPDGLDTVVVADTLDIPLGFGEMHLGAEQPVQALARTIATLSSGSKQVRRIARRRRANDAGGGDDFGGDGGDVDLTGVPVDPVITDIGGDDPLPIDPTTGTPPPPPPPVDPGNIPPYTIPVTAFQAPMILPPDFDIRSSDWARGLAGFNLGACENGPTDTAGTTTDTVWHFVASGSSGSYDVVRTVSAIFTVNEGDLEADIAAAMDAWWVSTGGTTGSGGTIAGDWDDWTWTLPGSFPGVTFSCDSTNLVGGTATATQSTVGQSGHASIEFNCGIGIGLSRDEGGSKADSEGFTAVRKRIGDIDSVAAWQAEQATLRKPRIGDIDTLVTTLTPGQVSVAAADDDTGTLKIGVIRVKQADKDKLEILNPDGTNYASGGGGSSIAASMPGPIVTATSNPWPVESDGTLTSVGLACYSGATPTADVDVDVNVNGSTEDTVTLPAGDSYALVTVAIDVVAGDIVEFRVTADDDTGMNLTVVAHGAA